MLLWYARFVDFSLRSIFIGCFLTSAWDHKACLNLTHLSRWPKCIKKSTDKNFKYFLKTLKSRMLNSIMVPGIELNMFLIPVPLKETWLSISTRQLLIDVSWQCDFTGDSNSRRHCRLGHPKGLSSTSTKQRNSPLDRSAFLGEIKVLIIAAYYQLTCHLHMLHINNKVHCLQWLWQWLLQFKLLFKVSKLSGAVLTRSNAHSSGACSVMLSDKNFKIKVNYFTHAVRL